MHLRTAEKNLGKVCIKDALSALLPHMTAKSVEETGPFLTASARLYVLDGRVADNPSPGGA